MKCNEKNCCAGAYGKCLDLKITNACNANCSFCIEKNGYAPKENDVEELVKTVNSLTEYDSLLILGGEPLLYKDLEILLQETHKSKTYLTTNGSLLDKEKAKMLSEYLTAINISVHYYTEELNDKVYAGPHISFEKLEEAIKVFNDNDVPVRINCNLVKGLIENRYDAINMIKFAKQIGANEIRFTELQNAEELAVNAADIFNTEKLVSENPYCDGCEKSCIYNGIKVIVKTCCGLVNKDKKEVTDPELFKGDTKVVYPNGEVHDGWLTKKEPTKEKSSYVHATGCHFGYGVSRGCH